MSNGGYERRRGGGRSPILRYVDPVKPLLRQLTADRHFNYCYYFLQQRLTEPILANFGLKSFQPKQRKAEL